MSKLRPAVDRLGEHRVEPMNEQKNIAATGRAERELGVERLKERLIAIEIFFVTHHEIGVWITGRRGSPLDFVLLVVRRNRDREFREIEGARSVAVEQRARPVVAFAGCRHKQGVVGRALGSVGDGAQKTGLRPGGAGNEGEREKHDRQNGKRPFQVPATP
jgi:hypothetical protein